MAQSSVQAVFSGLGTLAIQVPNVGTYSLQGNISLPSINQGATANSQVIVTINVNGGSTLYTGAAGAQGFVFLPITIASANSTVNVILSSATGVDQGLNLIKTTVSISELT
jgi:hypothetical protein